MNPPDEYGMVTFLRMDENGNPLCGHMDVNGNVIVPPTYCVSMYEYSTYRFTNGYAVFEDILSERLIILDTAGREVFSEPAEFSLIQSVMSNGLIWYYQDGLYGLIRIGDGQAVKSIWKNLIYNSTIQPIRNLIIF